MKKSILSIMLGALYAIAITACSDDDASDTSNVSQATVKVTNLVTLGKVLTDKAGRTLYFFSRDTKGESVCEGDCTNNWPVFYEEDITIESSDVDVNDFSSVMRKDGRKQTLYKGYPLYYFNQDAVPGDAKGEKIMDVWYVAKPDYSLMYSKSQLIGANGLLYKSDYTEGQEETFYLTDPRGRILYTFKNDKNQTNNFTTNPANNAAVWPIFPSTLSSLVVPSIFNKSDFNEITVNGQRQLTFRGWPLYYFGGTPTVSGDVNKGDTRGVSFPMPGVWPVPNNLTPVAPN